MTTRTIRTSIRGRIEVCRILRVRGMGTVDVEVIRSGRCYRVTGLGHV